jgi:hypothetical protein
MLALRIVKKYLKLVFYPEEEEAYYADTVSQLEQPVPR